MNKGTRRTRTKDFSVGNIYMPPESSSRLEDAQRRIIAADARRYQGQGEVMILGDYNGRLRKAEST